MSANAASLSATYRPADTATSAFSWGRYTRTGLLTIGASVAANAVFFYLAQVGVQYDPAFLPLGNVSRRHLIAARSQPGDGLRAWSQGAFLV